MDNIKNVRDRVEQLINSDHSTNKIARTCDIPASSISRIRSHERLLDNLTFSSIERLYNGSLKIDE